MPQRCHYNENLTAGAGPTWSRAAARTWQSCRRWHSPLLPAAGTPRLSPTRPVAWPPAEYAPVQLLSLTAAVCRQHRHCIVPTVTTALQGCFPAPKNAKLSSCQMPVRPLAASCLLDWEVHAPFLGFAVTSYLSANVISASNFLCNSRSVNSTAALPSCPSYTAA